MQPLLDDLCAGLSEAELPAALAGLQAEAPHVRGAAVAALSSVPFLAHGARARLAAHHRTAAAALSGERGAGEALASPAVAAGLWVARHDADGANVAAARQLWDELGAELTPAYVAPVLVHLRHAHADVRAAAAAALAGGIQVGRQGRALRHAGRLHEVWRSPGLLQEHPDTAGDVLRGILRTYAEAAGASARSGAALALAACAAHTSERDVPHALDFLLGQAVADPSDVVRAQMLDAGARSTRPRVVRAAVRSPAAPCSAWQHAERLLTSCVVLLSRRRAGGRARRRRGQERHAAAV